MIPSLPTAGVLDVSCPKSFPWWKNIERILSRHKVHFPGCCTFTERYGKVPVALLRPVHGGDSVEGHGLREEKEEEDSLTIYYFLQKYNICKKMMNIAFFSKRRYTERASSVCSWVMSSVWKKTQSISLAEAQRLIYCCACSLAFVSSPSLFLLENKSAPEKKKWWKYFLGYE